MDSSLTPEQIARTKIDAQLDAAGWAVQDYKAFNPGASRGIALREVPLDSGRCDYLLLVDRIPTGVIEAKKEGTTLSTVADQSAHYAENLPDFLADLLPSKDRKLPFAYESTGVETYFRDERNPQPRSAPASSAFPISCATGCAIARSRRSPTSTNRFGAPQALVQLATDTDKTNAGSTSSYRLVRHTAVTIRPTI